MWLIGPVEVENPLRVSRKTTHALQKISAGDWPILLSIGVEPVVLTLDLFVQNGTEQELYELSLNRSMQPIRIVDEDHRRSGYYYIRSQAGEERGGVVNWITTRVDCYLFGGLGQFVSGFRVTDLEKVENDWNI